MFNKATIEKISNLLDPLNFLSGSNNNTDDDSFNFHSNNSLQHDSFSRSVESDISISQLQIYDSITNSIQRADSTSLQKTENPIVELTLLTGEVQVMSIKDSFIQISIGKMITGTLIMTNYRLSFIPSVSESTSNNIASTSLPNSSSSSSLLLSSASSNYEINNPWLVSWLNIPLSTIDKIDRDNRPQAFGTSIVITCKDIRQHRISLPYPNIEKALSTLYAYVFPRDIINVFAFAHKLTYNSNLLNINVANTTPSITSSSSAANVISSMEPFDIIIEFSRQGLDNLDPANTTTNNNNPTAATTLAANVSNTSHFRCCYANMNYQLCPTYPSVMIMPIQMTDFEFETVANFRSGRRLPTLTYYYKYNHASLWRSSQPKVGVVSNSCWQDEKLLELIAQSRSFIRYSDGTFEKRKDQGESILHIVDCRPRSSAFANSLSGAGFESQSNYNNTRLEFYNIPNIHAVRDSFQKLYHIVLQSTHVPDPYYSKKIEDTQWLVNLKLILKASWETASFINKGYPVLVHCSHGWDRTSQVCSLAQVFMDPYYRTIDGFKILIQKDWLVFGHPFQLRCNHACDHLHPTNAYKQQQDGDQTSPIFLQFLDCVYQIFNQYPQYFEFNHRYLLAIANEIYSCRFGTFLFNCHSDKVCILVYCDYTTLFVMLVYML